MKTMKTTLPKAAAVAAALRVGGAMKDRRAPRGGARNNHREWLAEAEEAKAERELELRWPDGCPIGK